MHKYLMFLSIFLFSFVIFAQPDIQSQKDSLALNLDVELNKSLLLSIAQYYSKSGQRDKDSLRKYDLILLELLKEEPPSMLKARAKELRLIADFRLPFAEYAVLAKDLIEDYKILKNYKGLIKEQFYLANKAHTAGEANSFILYREGLDLLKRYEENLEAEDFCRWTTRNLASTASNYDYVGLYDEAIEMVLKAVEQAESCNDSTSLLYAYVPAGAILGASLENVDLNKEKWPDLEERLISYLSQTKILADALEKNITSALASYNLAYYYYSINDLEKSKKYLQDSWNTEGIEWLTRQVYLNHGLEADLLYKQGKKAASLISMKKSSYSALELNEPLSIFQSQIEMSRWYLQENQLEEAGKALSTLDTMLLNNLEKRRDYYELKYQIAVKTDAKEVALKNLELYHAYKDSINNTATSQRIASILAKYDMTIAESKITLLESENAKDKLQFQRQIAIGFALLILLTVGFVIYFLLAKQRLLQSRQENQEVQQQLFRAQMNPHFIFNTLGSIQSFLLHKGRAKEAAYFLTKFAKLMRLILAQSQQSFISLQDEIDTLNHYLLLQKMRFEERFDFEIEVDSEIDMKGTQVPPMILQPIIENAIEHGKIYNQADGIVFIGVALQNDALCITIEDNGLGQHHRESVPLIKKEDSFSLAIIRKRLEFVGQHFKQISKMNVSQPISGGTIVQIRLPRITNATT